MSGACMSFLFVEEEIGRSETISTSPTTCKLRITDMVGSRHVSEMHS